MENLFAYGTLMLPAIQQELFGRELVGENDILKNYIKNEITIDNEVYSNKRGSCEQVILFTTSECSWEQKV